MGELHPRLTVALLGVAHLLSDHVPVNHRTVLGDGGARAGGRGRTSRPGIRDKGNADSQRHAENNSEQHAHDGLPSVPTLSSRAENALDRDWFRRARIEVTEIAAWPEVGNTGGEFIESTT